MAGTVTSDVGAEDGLSGALCYGKARSVLLVVHRVGVVLGDDERRGVMWCWYWCWF